MILSRQFNVHNSAPKDASSMIIEAHDDEVGNATEGTLAARAGHKGSIEFPYQGEMFVQEMLGDYKKARRFYAYGYGVAWAVWARDEQGAIHYVAKDPAWTGEWELPFLTPATGIAVAMFGPEAHNEVHDMDEAAVWATKWLNESNIATAVVLDKDGVLAAWEKGPEGPVLVTKGPRPLPVRNATQSPD